jgi:fibronectin-binding autotransporter adhesin
MMKIQQFLIACAISVFALAANAATFTVTTNADSGAGSLRQAILDANTAPGSDRIEFNITSGSMIITPSTLLPGITGTTTIDGTRRSPVM